MGKKGKSITPAAHNMIIYLRQTTTLSNAAIARRVRCQRSSVGRHIKLHVPNVGIVRGRRRGRPASSGKKKQGNNVPEPEEEEEEKEKSDHQDEYIQLMGGDGISCSSGSFSLAKSGVGESQAGVCSYTSDSGDSCYSSSKAPCSQLNPRAFSFSSDLLRANSRPLSSSSSTVHHFGGGGGGSIQQQQPSGTGITSGGNYDDEIEDSGGTLRVVSNSRSASTLNLFAPAAPSETTQVDVQMPAGHGSDEQEDSGQTLVGAEEAVSAVMIGEDAAAPTISVLPEETTIFTSNLKRLREILSVGGNTQQQRDERCHGALVDAVLQLKRQAEGLEKFKNNGVLMLASNLAAPPTPSAVIATAAHHQDKAHHSNEEVNVVEEEDQQSGGSDLLQQQQATTSSLSSHFPPSAVQGMKTFLNTMWEAVVRSNELGPLPIGQGASGEPT